MSKQANKNNQEKPFTGLLLWKVVGMFALVYAAVQLAIGAIAAGMDFLMDAINASDNLRVFLGSTISRTLMAAAILLITLPVIRSVFNKSGLQGLYPAGKKNWKDLLIGMAITVGAMVIIFILELTLGFITVSGFSHADQSQYHQVQALWLALLANSITVLGAEVLYRGLLLQGVEMAWDRWGALFISSIIFGGAQVFTAGITETDWLTNVPFLALPGVMLGWSYLRTGNLWLASGIHFAWILFRDDILNLTTLNHGKTPFGLDTNIKGPQWFTGGAFGFEASGAGILCLLLVSAGIWWWTKRTTEKAASG